jgi:hypothetical protein
VHSLASEGVVTLVHPSAVAQPLICPGEQHLPAATNNSTAQHSTAQHSTAQHSTAQHSTAQHSTAQHSTAQHSTAQQQSFRSCICKRVVEPFAASLADACYWRIVLLGCKHAQLHLPDCFKGNPRRFISLLHKAACKALKHLPYARCMRRRQTAAHLLCILWQARGALLAAMHASFVMCSHCACTAAPCERYWSSLACSLAVFLLRSSSTTELFWCCSLHSSSR